MRYKMQHMFKRSLVRDALSPKLNVQSCNLWMQGKYYCTCIHTHTHTHTHTQKQHVTS